MITEMSFAGTRLHSLHLLPQSHNLNETVPFES